MFYIAFGKPCVILYGKSDFDVGGTDALIIEFFIHRLMTVRIQVIHMLIKPPHAAHKTFPILFNRIFIRAYLPPFPFQQVILGFKCVAPHPEITLRCIIPDTPVLLPGMTLS